MEKQVRVLAVNPGSTSTKIALFDDYDELFSTTINHSAEELKALGAVQDQLEYRTETVEKAMESRGFALDS